MKLFKTTEIKKLDAYTIQNEPVLSIDLMERASRVMADFLLHRLEKESRIVVLSGPGNNGGDGLALARLLSLCSFSVEVFLLCPSSTLSSDCAKNLARLRKQRFVIHEVRLDADAYPLLNEETTVIDALFGSGLNRPLEGLFRKWIVWLNGTVKRRVVSVDVPSGLFGEDNSTNDMDAVVRADCTLTLQFPKMSFLMPQAAKYAGKVHVMDISLHPEGIRRTLSDFFLTERVDLPSFGCRDQFAHKGTFGHALFIGGSRGKAGAAVLASKACMRTGVGLLTCYVPRSVERVLQVSVPEAMCLPSNEEDVLTEEPAIERYSAVGIGCGLGCLEETAQMVKQLLAYSTRPMVIDADALNILSEHTNWQTALPEGSILTPHPKEWERISGVPLTNRWKQIDSAREFCLENRVIVILKGAFTAVVLPDGTVHFNSTGNAGMATAGSGDVLCGVLLSLLSQGMSPEDAAVLGVYLHGEAGDEAASRFGMVSMVSGDIIDALPSVIRRYSKEKVIKSDSP